MNDFGKDFGLVLPLETAERFARLGLENVVREYPNYLCHLTTGPDDFQSPRQLHPIFYGSFDWHSCVHGYWLLARLLRITERLSLSKQIEAHLDSAFTPENVAAEMQYFESPTNRQFERPYGWAWLLMLVHELRLHQHEKGRRWHAVLMPLADLIALRFLEYLPKADYPVRAGMHSNSAFAIALAFEFANSHGNRLLSALLQSSATKWYQSDVDCPVWEPSQSDFLSPALIESLCMLRVLPPDEFSVWFERFLPHLRDRLPAALFVPANVSDQTDNQIVHLHGLNLSRAWCFGAIGRTLPINDELTQILMWAAQAHLDASLPRVFGSYAGEHWLATFALLALS